MIRKKYFYNDHNNGNIPIFLMGVESGDLSESLDSPRIQSIIGRNLLIECLKELRIFHEYPQYRYNEYGKPYLANYPDWYFNISHCNRMVVCAVSSGEIGIDVESYQNLGMDLLDSVLNPSEAADVLNSPNPLQRFTQLWTQKESLLKYLGFGLNSDLKQILNQYIADFKSISTQDSEITICHTAIYNKTS